ncbi:vitamin B12-dependent ribonucleotide reductase [Tunturiibacter empetritectus]|uniref:Vitamin B12-dependent ribonucleotide reductase n=1 Tax=Tunturiibacter lichenicola TaxID=2051959 RepID=A0A852V9A1_9BACT|nr:vitamin B12-dependent ribonucleotide reductase [Edaphobacter lichenicola]NYF88270.1 ribonucleoside-diphosphate reductase alpha chain [Edaphobacter lichenicola]
MATIPNQTHTQGQSGTQTTPGAAGFKNQRTPGLTFDRHSTKPGVSPYDEIVWELRDAIIQDFKGKIIFEQKNVEVPADWSMTATNIVASKYLHGLNGSDERESGVRALITRVSESIRDWGIAGGYFASQADADTFYAELAHLLLNQKVAFNSPVWFNVGCDRLEPNSDAQNWHWNATTGKVEFSVTGYTKPQCSACFINSVQDSLDSILTLAKTEGMLFKWGSGAGSNLSNIRGSMETLSGGGTASGPLSFMRGFDAFAGVIKSGGKTRRAAKMVILNVDHPDINDFIQCKVKEEQKAWHLMQAGYDGSGPDSEAYSSIFFQNANNSVRVNDEFMRAVESDGSFVTRTVKERTPVKEYKARDLMHSLAEATWQCGDPGMQFDTTINKWHTSKNTGRINASNPCSEYMFLDDSACNLASFNLLKFLTPGGQFDIPSYRHAIEIVTTAMEIIVDSAGYPTEMISKNSHDYRPLGLGYANLGALLMAFGLPYDSDAGRDFAATLTSILCGDAYWQSSRIAETCPPLGAATPLTQQASIEGGACPGFYVNREPFLDVVRMHRAEVNNIGKSKQSTEPFSVPQLDTLIEASRHAWDGALAHGEKHGYRNSQVTVLAPTGTIGFMMDCDTTGIEPDLALVKYKKLVGGGMIKIVNNTVPSALIKLGYDEAQVNAIVSYIDATGTIEGAPAIKPEHLAVFDCSFKPSKGTRSISYMGHIKMMGATQPFLSGAISKTVNLPQDCSVDDIAEAYMESWRQGLKAVAIYRDNSKGTQPLNVTAQTDDDKKGTRSTNVAGTRSTNAVAAAAPAASVAPAVAAQVEIDEAVEAARAAARQQLTEAMETATAAHVRIHSLEVQLKQIAEAALQNSDAADSQAPPRAVRHRLPAERASVTHKFGLAGHEGYITVGLYPNGQPGEIFIRMAKEGSTVSGLMDSFATAVSLALQHGVPLRVLCEKFAHTRFEPSGWTGNEQIGYAKSIMDYIFRWIQIRFLSGHQFDLFAGLTPQNQGQSTIPTSIPVEGTVNAPGNRIESLNLSGPSSTSVLSNLNASSNAVIPSEAQSAEKPALSGAEGRNPRILSSSEPAPNFEETYHPTTPPQQGIAPEPSATIAKDLSARSGLESPNPMSLEDRGIYHASDAMKSMYEMGDSPSCATCGAIMTRSGSCYRCMSCGSTSGCS